MAIAAVFALLCTAIVFTGCPNANQNKGSTSNIEKEKQEKEEQSKKEKEEKEKKEKEEQAKKEKEEKEKKEKEEQAKKEKEEKEKEEKKNAPFIGDNDKSIWKIKDRTNIYEGKPYYYYVQAGKVYFVVYDKEKKELTEAREIGTVKESKIMVKESFKNDHSVEFRYDFNGKETVVVKISGNTLLIDAEGTNPRSFSKEDELGLVGAVKKSFKDK